MKPRNHYDVFLSYRRAGGQETALLLFDRLTAKGYRVAYDIETLRSGRFDEQLLGTVDGCRDVVVILAPGSLDRCVAWEERRKDSGDADGEDPDDWMRREIARALRSGVNVVPVILRGFSFPKPEALPADIRALPLLNGVEASTMHFNDTLAHIEDKLAARPRKRLRARAIAAAAAIAAMSAAAVFLGGANGCWRSRQYPKTRLEVQQVEDYLSVLKSLGSVYGEALSQMQDLAAEAGAAADTGDARSYRVAARAYSARMLDLYDRAGRIALSDEAAAALRSSPLSVPGLTSLLSERAADIRGARSVLPAQFDSMLDPGNPLSKPDKAKLVAWMSESIRLDGESCALEIMRLVLPASPESLERFQTEAAAWPVVGAMLKGELIRDSARIEREMKSVESRGGDTKRKISEFAGGLAFGAAGKQRELETDLLRMGTTSEDAERISGNAALVGAMQSELADMKTVVDAKRADAYAKHRALPGDDPGTLWSKALRFRAVGLPQGALEALSLARQSNSAKFPEAAIAAMEAIVKLGDDAPPARGGIVAAGFEPPATSHAVFRLGDVVVERNGIPVRRVEDYTRAGAGKCVFYRLDANGEFQRRETTVPPGEPRIAWLETVEDNER